MKKLISLLICVLLLLSTVNAIALEGGLGDVYMTVTDTPSQGLTYSERYATNSSGKQISYTYTFSAGADTELAIGRSHGIYGRKTTSAIADFAVSSGKNVVGSVNGNTFSLQSGVTDGTLISEGKLISWDDNGHNAVAVKKDGTTVIGTPDISLSFTYGSETYAINALNKWSATQSGICLFTDDFAPSTKSSGSRIEIILKPQGDVTLMGQELDCTVISINKGADSLIPDGCILLSIPSNHATAAEFSALKASDKLIVSSVSSQWLDVTFSTGTDKQIIQNGKAINTATTDNDGKELARTAIAIKESGELIFFVCDADGVYGMGLTTVQVCEELISMGASDAFYLDCGASSTVTKNGATLANHPSLGEEKPIGSSILFINSKISKETDRILIAPTSPTVFKQGFVPLSCTAVNAAGEPTGDTLTNITYYMSEPLGTISGSLFRAGSTAGSVTITAKANCNGKTVSGSTVINIITSLDGIFAKQTRVYVPVGGQADVRVMGIRYARDVYLCGYSLNWSLNGASETEKEGAVISCKYGYLDNRLIFHANEGYSDVSFTLNAKYGSTTVPIKIIIGKPSEVITSFDDPSLVFSGYLTTDASQSFKYENGKFQTYGLTYSGTGITYKTPIPLGYNAESLSIWVKGSSPDPYAIIEMKNGSRQQIPLSVSKDLYDYNGWRMYTLHFPADAHRIISPLKSDKGLKCTLDEITISYGTKTPAFKDIGSSWAKKEIELIYDLDITSGYGSKGNQTYKPANYITRAEFAKMIVTYYKLNVNSYKNTALPFRDSASIPSWALPYVRAAVAEGLIGGSTNPDGSLSFLPNDNITRAQVATIIGRKLDAPAANIAFTDKKAIPSYALNGLAKCVTAGVISGYPDGTFKPSDFITRAEVAKVITNLYNYSYNR